MVIEPLSSFPNPRARLNSIWSGSVVERFADSLALGPDNPCIKYGSQVWSYKDVEEASNTLGGLLNSLGVLPQMGIAILADRKPSLTVALLAVLKLRCYFCIIDPKYPDERLRLYLRYVMPKVLLNLTNNKTGSSRLTELESQSISKLKEIMIPHDLDEICQFAKGNNEKSWLSLDIAPHHTMYISFTSGTTGIPKAIHGIHSPVSHFFDWQCRNFNITKEDKVSVISGLAHDPLLRDVLMPLWAGASMVFPDEDAFDRPGRIFRWINREGITITHLTPSIAHLAIGARGFIKPGELRNLRLIFSGGEPLTPTLLSRLEEVAPNAIVVNCYGATETPQVAAYYIVGKLSQSVSQLNDRKRRFLPIGQGIEGCQLIILDDNEELADPNKNGQICIRTPYLAKKIENMDGSPCNSIICNPFTSEPVDRIYLSGDYGRYLEDGTVEFLGRKDRQVKVRGFRVDLAEIEQTLVNSGKVSKCYASLEGEPGLERVVLFAEPLIWGKITSKELKEVIAMNLPQYMIPDQIVLYAEIPVTPNGKLDREWLRQQYKASYGTKAEEMIGWKDLSGQLLRLSRELLAYPNLSIKDDLIESGINSIDVVQLACMIYETTGYEIGIDEIFMLRTIENILRVIAGKHNTVMETNEYVISNDTGQSDISYKDEKVRHDQYQLGSECTKEMDLGDTYDRRSPRLLPINENPIVGIKNRILQLLARVAPDAFRARLHRVRGVHIGQNVSIGYDTIIETSYPWLVEIGNNVNIGMRVTIIGHFRGMTASGKMNRSVRIRSGAFVGPGVIVLPNVNIGVGAVVAAGSVVSSSVPPMTLVRGNPAKPIAYCTVPLTGNTTYEDFLRQLKPINNV